MSSATACPKAARPFHQKLSLVGVTSVNSWPTTIPEAASATRLA